MMMMHNLSLAGERLPLAPINHDCALLNHVDVYISSVAKRLTTETSHITSVSNNYFEFLLLTRMLELTYSKQWELV